MYMKICIIPMCPEKTYGRLRDATNTMRRDLCKTHFKSTLDFYNTKDAQPQNKLYVVKIWGEKDATA